MLPLDLSDETTIEDLLAEIDHSIQWGENLEVDDSKLNMIEENI